MHTAQGTEVATSAVNVSKCLSSLLARVQGAIAQDTSKQLPNMQGRQSVARQSSQVWAKGSIMNSVAGRGSMSYGASNVQCGILPYNSRRQRYSLSKTHRMPSLEYPRAHLPQSTPE